MRKPMIMICLIVTLLVISACSGSATQSQPNGNPPSGSQNQSASPNSGSSKDTTNYLGTSYTNALSVPMQLMLGTMNLKGTDNEVDTETAQQLITLWKAVKVLSSSDTTSSLEMDGLYKQIERAMTKEQLTAISDMKLSRDNMMQISQELGLSIGGAGMGTMTEEQKATAEASQSSGSSGAPAGGAMMGGPGGGPDGGMMGGGPPGQSSSSSSSSSNASTSTAQNSQIDSNLIEALIEYLASRVQ